MKAKILIFLATIELIGFSVAIGHGLHLKHYHNDNYPHQLLVTNDQPKLFGLYRDNIKPFFAFIGLAELYDTSALAHSASFCQLVIVCLNENQKKEVRLLELENYQIVKSLVR